MAKAIVNAEPVMYIGSASPGNLMLPDAQASPRTLYGPRGVFYKEPYLVVADTGNHRVLIWKYQDFEGFVQRDSDIVLGQPDFYSDSPNAGGDPERGMFMPTGIFISEDNKLFVADAWNHRVLIWDKVPEESFSKPDHVVGQPDLRTVEQGALFWCFGVYYDGNLYVCDTGHGRVLKWRGIPDRMEEPDSVYEGFGWPHAFCKCGDYFFVADAGTGVSKVFAFYKYPGSVGQETFYIGEGEGCGQTCLNLPYGVSSYGDLLCVADTSNNRVLLFKKPWRNRRPICVLGQRSFAECGENRWEQVSDDTLCWPYAVHLSNGLVFIADTGNNRVTVWRIKAD